MSQVISMRAMELKRIVKAISKIDDQALLEFSEDALFFQVINTKTQLSALLKISIGFFREYHLTRPFIVKVNLSTLSKILSSVSYDDGEVHILTQDENPISHLEFLVKNRAFGKNKREKLKVSEIHNIDMPRRESEPDYEFKVGIKTALFGFIAKNSAIIEEPVGINVTYSLLTLTSGSHIISQTRLDSIFENVSRNMQYELQINLHEQADCFILASDLTDVVYLKDSLTGSDQNQLPLLEFPIGEFSKLQFYFPMCFRIT